MNFVLKNFKKKSYENAGMSLLELLLAVSMLAVFTGVVAMVMQFTLRFFDEAESGQLNEDNVFNGVLIDHQQLHIMMDSMVEILVQPGVSLDNISYSQKESPLNACSSDPVFDWGLEDLMDTNKVRNLLPPGYRLCLWKTTKTSQSGTAVGPSIYLLQALPKKISSSSLPIRRLFCRPRPFC